MAEYSVVVRFSDAAVADVNWDDQQHTGSATITDETTGNVYELGGSEPMFLKCTATLSDGEYVLDKSYKDLKDAFDAGILPYLEIIPTVNNTTYEKHLPMAALEKRTIIAEETTEYLYYVAFGIDLSGLFFQFDAQSDTDTMHNH